MLRAATAVACCLLATAALGAPRGRRPPQARVRPGGPSQPGSTCRPGRNLLTYHGGELIENAQVFVLFWGDAWQSDPAHVAVADDLRALYQALGTSGYACAAREYATAARPIDAWAWVGDEVIAAPPVSPPTTELDDAVIRARIGAEIDAGNAPAPSADMVYVVLPPRGVPVRAFAETGCGGSNFTFCGYHDSFRRGAERVRYAVLPFPCDAGGFTCFVDAARDASRALEVTGSHELAEMVTDPDAPPVGAGGWFDDGTGEENADICQRQGCDVDLPIAGDHFRVNATWSNLANGCVATAPCAAPPVGCTDPAPGLCTPGGSGPRDCAFEWEVYPNLTLDRAGMPGPTVTCGDGQPFCDFDGVADGRCTFHLAACLNSADPRLACAPAPIGSIALSRPLPTAGDPADRANAATILGALATADGSSVGALSGPAVTYTPPAAHHDACTAFVDVVVPVRQIGTRLARGTRSIRLTARTPVGSDRDQLTLVCNPAP